MERRRYLSTIGALALSLLMCESAPAQRCNGFTLSNCRLALRFRHTPAAFDRFTVTCTVTPANLESLDMVRDGLSVKLGTATVPNCYVQQTMPTRLGRCFRYRTTDPVTGGRVNLRVCPDGANYRLRFHTSKADIQCLSQQRTIITVQSGENCGSTSCRLRH
jgi:hypothetical protein